MAKLDFAVRFIAQTREFMDKVRGTKQGVEDAYQGMEDQAKRTTQEIDQGLESNARSANVFSNSLNFVRRNLGKITAGLVGFVKYRIFSSSIKEAEALDVQMRKLEATIAATGGAAGLTSQEIDQMARRLDEATTGSAAGFRDAATQLLTFKSVGKDAFETTLMLAQDLADAGFGSVTSNAVQLGRALEDPVRGMTLLQRSGVTLSQSQQDLVRSLMETGKHAQAQAVILEAVEGQVGGVAAAIGGGLTGALDLVSKRFTDIREQLGKAFLPLLQGAAERLAEFQKRLIDTGAVEKFGNAIAATLTKAKEAFFNFLDQVDFDELIDNLKVWASTTRETASEWIANLQNVGNYTQATFSVIAAGLNTIKGAFFGTAAALGLVVQFVAESVSKFYGILGVFSETARRASEAAKDVSISLGESVRINYEKAGQAIADATQNGYDFRDAQEAIRETNTRLTEGQDELTESTKELGEQQAETAEVIGLTADQLDALGDNIDYTSGALEDVADAGEEAAKGIEKAGDAADDTEAEMLAAEKAALALAQAYKELGVTSQAELEEAAQKARASFELIEQSGSATANQLQAAFSSYAIAAVAANDGVVSSALQAEAQQRGLKIEADETGRVIVTSMGEAARATREVESAAKDTAAAYREVAAEARNAANASKESSGSGGGEGSGSGRTSRTTSRTATTGKYTLQELRSIDESLAEMYAEAIAEANRGFSPSGGRTAVSRSQYERAMRDINTRADALVRRREMESQQQQVQPESKANSLDEISKAMEQALANAIPQAQAASKKTEVTLNLPGGIRTSGMFDDNEAERLVRELQRFAEVSR